MVEDSKADLFLIREAIAAAQVEAVLHVVHDGEQALQIFEELDRSPGTRCPDLVLLDLNLPKKDGASVLRSLRNTSVCKDVKVLIVTSSDSSSDRESVNALGLSGYFRKPSAYADFMKLGPIVKDLLASS